MNVELNKVYNEDCLEFMKRLPDNCLDSIVSDPPYGLSEQPDIYEVLKCWMNAEPYKHTKKGFMQSSIGSFVASPNSKVDYIGQEVEGRWPCDIVHDGSEVILDMFEEFGETKSSKTPGLRKSGTNGSFLSDGGNFETQAYGDEGSAARMFNSLEYDDEDLQLMFYHCAKPSIADKDEGLEKYFEVKQNAGEYCLSSHNGESRLEKSLPRFNIHPTIKSTALMRWLCKLLTPKGGLIYDPFSGSGSTGKAAMIEGFKFIGTELDEEFSKIANARVEFALTNRELLLSKNGKPLLKNKKRTPVSSNNEFF